MNHPCLLEGDLKKMSGVNRSSPYIFLESAPFNKENSRSFFFSDFTHILAFNYGDDLSLFFKKIESFLQKGFWLCGYFSYEFGYFLEPALCALKERNEFPLAWLGVCPKPIITKYSEHSYYPRSGGNNLSYKISNIKPSITQEEYYSKIKEIKSYLEEGLSYQVNFTFKLKFDFIGDALDLYLNLRRAQPTPYMAFINTGNSHILSLSPELFFRKRGSSIISRPMKGTAKRGLTLDKDKENLKWLARNKKTRAENIMIVDLLRNDLGKISQEVRVPRLFEIEKHRTLYQMTSTVKAKLKNNMKMKDIFFSLFPCGSVTGAPKIKTMEIIKDLEKEPRGVYTGAIGYISPQRDACFNIAIRTALIKDGKGEMGVGGGIVYDSIESSEYEEAMLKAKFLTQHFSEIFLIESMLWEENVGYFLLSLHLKRLRNSCGYFSIPLDIKQLKRKLIILEESLGRGKFKIRVSVSLNGDVKIEKEPLAEIATPVKVKLSLQRIDPQNMFLYHKTTHRDLYDRERKTAQEEGYFEVIFLNTNEEVTEGSITNVFISKNGLLYTPPIKCGLLGGVLREYFLKEGRAKEEVLYLKDILEAEKVYIGNSVRGILEAQISLADLINERKIKHTPNIIKASIQQ